MIYFDTCKIFKLPRVKIINFPQLKILNRHLKIFHILLLKISYPPTQNFLPSINENVQSQFPQFSTQAGLENINLEEEDNTTATSPRKKRESSSDEEDKILIQSWLNISKDSVIGINHWRFNGDS